MTKQDLNRVVGDMHELLLEYSRAYGIVGLVLNLKIVQDLVGDNHLDLAQAVEGRQLQLRQLGDKFLLSRKDEPVVKGLGVSVPESEPKPEMLKFGWLDRAKL